VSISLIPALLAENEVLFERKKNFAAFKRHYKSVKSRKYTFLAYIKTFDLNSLIADKYSVY